MCVRAGSTMTPARRFALKVVAAMPRCRAHALPLIPEASSLAAWSAIWASTTVRPRLRSKLVFYIMSPASPEKVVYCSTLVIIEAMIVRECF